MHGEPGSAEDIEKFKQYVIAAALASKGKGKHPAFADEFLALVRKPSVTWKEHLRRAATSVFKGRYTFARRSRRSHHTPMMMPSRSRTPNGAIIMIDTSGSISDEDLTQFVSECSGILRETGCKFLKIYFHDVMCYHIEEYDLNSINKIKATRGGTSHIDVFEKVNDSLRNDKVGMVVAFTDLYTDFPEKPSYPVIWAHPEEHGEGQSVPFGKKVEVKLTNESS
jgi:predicted metal-dependent peptidase